MVWVGREFKDHLVLTPLLGRLRLLKASLGLVLDTSRDDHPQLLWAICACPHSRSRLEPCSTWNNRISLNNKHCAGPRTQKGSIYLKSSCHPSTGERLWLTGIRLFPGMLVWVGCPSQSCRMVLQPSYLLLPYQPQHRWVLCSSWQAGRDSNFC